MPLYNGPLGDDVHRQRDDADADSARRQRRARADWPGLRAVPRPEGSRQDHRAGVLSARGPRHRRVLPPEGSADAHPRLGDALHARRPAKDHDVNDHRRCSGTDVPSSCQRRQLRHRAAGDALRARPRGHLRPRPRRAARRRSRSSSRGSRRSPCSRCICSTSAAAICASPTPSAIRRRSSRTSASRSARASSARRWPSSGPILVGDVGADPRYMGVGRRTSSRSWPCRCGTRARCSARSTCCRISKDAFTERDEAMLRQFAAHVAQAIVNARLFESEREYARDARDAGRDRPRDERASSISTSCSRASRIWSSG